MGHFHAAVVVILFSIVLYLPFVLSGISAFTGWTLDAALNGYTDHVDQPDLTVNSWMTGTYQRGQENRVSMMPPRGFMIKTYGTINLLLFDKVQKTGIAVGKQKDLFEVDYLNAELCLTDDDDFSLEKNKAALDQYVHDLVQLDRKLKEHGKRLFYYVAGSKASSHQAFIPDNYRAIANSRGVRAVDALRERLKETEIPFLVSYDLESRLAYPTFYLTGTHWSRVYEQTVSQEMIRLISTETGREYRQLELGDIQTSGKPFWRDDDLVELANVFWNPGSTYYEYAVRDDQFSFDSYEPLQVLIQGDSFALGLRKDIMENDPLSKVYYVTRDESAVDPNEYYDILYGDWSKMDWQRYLDETDIVVLEATEPLIKRYSFGFVQALLNALDDYQPGEKRREAGSVFDPTVAKDWRQGSCSGLYQPEGTFCWTDVTAEMFLEDPGVEGPGLEVEVIVPEQLFLHHESVTVRVEIQDELVREQQFDEPERVRWVIDSDEWAHDSNLCRLKLSSSAAFVPAHENPDSQDTRRLALQLIYAGGCR